ncbi:glycosyltransferase family 39 protein [Streptomyces sp. NPDC046976]|uniref:glycosyltransferase family 39 protein n=1 Tax=Streptomyces sp. NPDC046976 TaxID=3155258 RepID=UPI003407E059
MLALGLWGVDRGGMWRDEAVTFQVAGRTVPQIWRLVHGVDAVHGLYYVLLHAVLAVHADEVVLRLPSVAGAVLATALVAEVGARLARPRVGLWAGLLYAVNPMVGHYAQEGRSYALVAAGVMGATLLLLRGVERGAWWGYGLVLGVTCWLHEFAVLVVLAHGLSLALARVRGRVWRGWGCAAGAVLLSLLPMVVVSRAQAAQVAWLRRPTGETVAGLARQFFGASEGVYWVCLGLAVAGLLAGVAGRRGGSGARPAQIALAGAGARKAEVALAGRGGRMGRVTLAGRGGRMGRVTLAGRGGRTGQVTLAGVAAPLVVVPPGVLMLASQSSPPLYVDRYVLYALAGAPLLVAAGGEWVAGIAGRLRPGARRTPARVPAGLRPSGGASASVWLRLREGAAAAAVWLRLREGAAAPAWLRLRGASAVASAWLRLRGGISSAPARLRSREGVPVASAWLRLCGGISSVPARLRSREGAPVAPARPRSRGDAPAVHAQLCPREGTPLAPPNPRPHSDGRPEPGPRLPASARRSLRTHSAALLGLLAIALVPLQQFSLLQQDRDPARRPDDLAAIARAAAHGVRKGDAVLYLPAYTRNTELAYPGAFRGTRDLVLARAGDVSGTLYGVEVPAPEVRSRVAGVQRVWVVADRAVLAGRWTPRNPSERAKLDLLQREFTVGAEAVRGRTVVRLYVRPLSPASLRPPSLPPRPARW